MIEERKETDFFGSVSTVLSSRTDVVYNNNTYTIVLYKRVPFNSFRGIWILHDPILGKCQFIGVKYALCSHPQNALVTDCFRGYID